jgi:hypothetical protein
MGIWRAEAWIRPLEAAGYPQREGCSAGAWIRLVEAAGYPQRGGWIEKSKIISRGLSKGGNWRIIVFLCWTVK